MVPVIFQVSRKNEKKTGKRIKTERQKLESQLDVKIIQFLFIDSHYYIDLGCYWIKELHMKDAVHKSASGQLKDKQNLPILRCLLKDW